MAVQVDTSIGSDFTADVCVRGALRFDTVSSIYGKLKFGENGCKRFRIDLSGVEGADSAGVALCLSWIANGFGSTSVVSKEQIVQESRFVSVG